MKYDDIKHKLVAQDDGPGQTEVLVIPINDEWGRIIVSCHVGDKVYRLGSLAPRAKDIDPFVTGAKLAGWVVTDERQAND